MQITNPEVIAILNEHGYGLDEHGRLDSFAPADEESAWQAMTELSNLLDTTEGGEDKAEIRKVMDVIFEGAQECLFQDCDDDDEVKATADKWARFDDPEEPVLPYLAKAYNFDTVRVIEEALEKLISDLTQDQADTLGVLRKRRCSGMAFENIQDMLGDNWSDVSLALNEALDQAVDKAKLKHPKMKELLGKVDVPYVTEAYKQNKRLRLAEE